MTLFSKLALIGTVSGLKLHSEPEPLPQTPEAAQPSSTHGLSQEFVEEFKKKHFPGLLGRVRAKYAGVGQAEHLGDGEIHVATSIAARGVDQHGSGKRSGAAQPSSTPGLSQEFDQPYPVASTRQAQLAQMWRDRQRLIELECSKAEEEKFKTERFPGFLARGKVSDHLHSVILNPYGHSDIFESLARGTSRRGLSEHRPDKNLLNPLIRDSGILRKLRNSHVFSPAEAGSFGPDHSYEESTSM